MSEAFLSTVDALDFEVDQVDEGVDEWPNQEVRARIRGLRHDLLRVRRVIGPTREAFHHVVDRRVDVEGRELFPHKIEIEFGDAYDKLLRAVDGLDLARDLLSGARDYHQAKIANEQNEVMKRLTAVASILLVPTFIVGLYGDHPDDGGAGHLFPAKGLDLERSSHRPKLQTAKEASSTATSPIAT